PTLAPERPEREQRHRRAERPEPDPVAARELDVRLRCQPTLAREQKERERDADRDQEAQDHVQPDEADSEVACLQDHEHRRREEEESQVDGDRHTGRRGERVGPEAGGGEDEAAHQPVLGTEVGQVLAPGGDESEQRDGAVDDAEQLARTGHGDARRQRRGRKSVISRTGMPSRWRRTHSSAPCEASRFTQSPVPQTWYRAATVSSAHPRPKHTVPTGFSAVPPSGPATPVVETTMSAPSARRAPAAISAAVCSLTAPCASRVAAPTSSRRRFASLEYATTPPSTQGAV